MYDVFISYRRASGSERASYLSRDLEKEGYEVFFDAQSLREGPFEVEIDRAIDQCTYFLLLLAPGDLDRSMEHPETDWIVHEAQRALDNGKIIIPITIKAGFEFPMNCHVETIRQLSKYNICDLSGTNAAELVTTRLIRTFMRDSSARELADKYNKGITDPAYIEWELKTLKTIYHDIPFVHAFGRDYPAYVVPGSSAVTFPFESLTQKEGLNPVAEPMEYKSLPWFDKFKKIVGPHIHYPDLYGYTNNGFELDDEGKICGLHCTPRTYKESVYTCHILQYELWEAYQQIGRERIATLDDLPMRKRIHEGRTNREVIMDGCNRSALNDVSIAVIDLDGYRQEYCIATAIRTENVATFPGYLSFVPSGGFELYELEGNQSKTVINENFSVSGALFREYLEELFGDKAFGQPTGDDDLNRLRKNPKIRELMQGVRAGTHKFEFLGVDFDLITLRQTLAFVLRIDDENFFYNSEFRKNEENVSIRLVPLKTLEEYIVETNAPPMVEMAATFALLRDNHLYQEMVEHQFGLIVN